MDFLSLFGIGGQGGGLSTGGGTSSGKGSSTAASFSGFQTNNASIGAGAELTPTMLLVGAGLLIFTVLFAVIITKR